MGVLAGRVAVVTGASRGLGEYVARRFAAEGAAVAVVARTQEQADERLPGTIHQTVATIRAAGGTAVAIRADLSKPAHGPRIIDAAAR
jgi:7-alpha-hydroxysteroid dehydrogenase